jgi:hypothetical protein
MKKLLLFTILLFPSLINSQSAGDIAFIAYNGDGNDDFAFVVLSEISSGTVIYFTDNEWTGSAFNDTNEGRVEWTATSTVDAGTVVVITDVNGSESANVGNVSEIGNLNLGASDDCLWALNAAPATSYGSAPTFYGVICNDIANGDTVTGTGLTLGTNGINFDNDRDGFLYTGSRSNQASFSAYLSQIYNSSNWQQETSNGENILPISTTAFTITGGSVDPEPSNQPTGFSASVAHEKITLTWTDAATGSQAPSKYIIIGETDNSISNPVDGTAISSEADASDNRVVININHGVQTTSFSNVGNSTWYFEIFPYTNSGSDIDFKTDGTIQTASATTNAIQITELVYNTPGSDWEWIELYNPTGSSIDISDYTISDASNNTLTFSSGTSIAAESYLTATLGGSGSAQFTPDFDGSGNVSYTYSYGMLNNSGDTVSLKDSSSELIDQVIYDDSSPWPTSPDGNLNSLEIIDLTKNNYYGASWQGSFNEYGTPGGKSSEAWDTSLTSSSNLTISSPNHVVITGNREINDITVNSGASLSIEKAASLTVSGNFTNNGTTTLRSDSNEFSSLIIQGTSSGNIIYNRYVNSLSNGSGWDLIGSPVNGLQISSFASTNDSPLATGNGSGAGASGEYAIGVFNSASNSWSNYTTANVSTTQFTPGKGYQMATDSGATLAFTGTVDTDATETIAIQNYAAASGSRWNLISNPYPSFLTIGPNTTTDTFLEVNDDVIDATYVGVYGYDGNSADGSNYTIYNNTSTGKIAPGQGFFVAARSSSFANITFKEAMQTTSTGDDFFEGDAFQFNEVELRLSNEENYVGKTNIFFIEGLSNGLDIGWDAGSFSQNASIMSRMIEEDEGHGMAINAMGLDAMESTVIPIVINQPAGQEFRVSLFTATIPNTNVYLEDNVLSTFTNLYEQDYIHTSDVDLSEVGRFFIHMTEDTMSNTEYSTNLLNVFKRLDADYITVEGLASQSNETKVSLFDILGKNIINQTFDNNTNTQTISTTGLQAGIYIVHLQSDKTVSKKISIQ